MDWWSLISKILDPILAKCFSKFSTEDPRDYLRAHYDPNTHTMDPSIVHDSMNSTRRAIRKARLQVPPRDRKDFPRYSTTEVYNMTEKKLIDAMNASTEAITEAFATAASVSEED